LVPVRTGAGAGLALAAVCSLQLPREHRLRHSGCARADHTGFKQTEAGPASGADGLAIDAQGRLYVASSAGVEIFDKRGKGLGVIELPKQPQNLAFAGVDRRTLYVVGRGAVWKIRTLAGGPEGRGK